MPGCAHQLRADADDMRQLADSVLCSMSDIGHRLIHPKNGIFVVSLVA